MTVATHALDAYDRGYVAGLRDGMRNAQQGGLEVGAPVRTPDGTGLVVRHQAAPAGVEVLHDDRSVGLGGHRIHPTGVVAPDLQRAARLSAWTVLGEERVGR